MAQQGGKRKQAPAYSADTMALRYIAGLALAALGVMIFMAVDLGMRGNIFDGLRQAAFGATGNMAYILAALPVWAGALVIWSAQRKPPVKPWIFAMLSFTGICAFLVLISKTSSSDYLTYLEARGGAGWGQAIRNGYEMKASGGALGVIFAWPLWRLSPALGILLYLAGTIFCLLMIFNLTPARIRAIVTGQAGRFREQKQEERRIAEEQQMAWQQQQAMQQAAWQQQQAYILQQQQQEQYRQQQMAQAQQAQQMPQQPVMPAGNQGRGGNSPGMQSVANWQEQLTTAQTAAVAAGVHESRIFGKKQAAAEKPGRGWKSRIFSKKEEEYDGLVGAQEEETPAQQPRKPARRTAASGGIASPETKWNIGTEEEAPAQPGRPTRKTAEPAVQTWMDPEPAAEPQTKTAEVRIPESRNRDAYRRPEDREDSRKQENRDAYRRPEDRQKPDSREAYRRPSEAAEQESEKTRTQPRQPAAAAGRSSAPVKAPAVQQEIGKEAYTPELKLTPSEKAPGSREAEEWIPIPYNFPPITDLAPAKGLAEDTSAEDAMRSRKLEETLASFKVQARVVNVTHGPAISRFEMELAAGTKVNKVAELEKDIAYGMEATSIRIEAPIPGKSLVGVEVPNRKVATVTLREVLESEKMQNAKSLLTVALGKDIAGTPIVCDLAKMPHMLIAGQTGSGKSVCINAIINSLLYRAGPDEVKLILVDPKVVELQCYNGIPHLLIPVVNDPHKAAAALAWAVAEMMERYDKFAERKVRNLEGYNAGLKQNEKPMARIVIIIDELADLMMVCKKDVEEYICRLTQLARAAGIHLIVATQRPSVDVITGLIKANIPSRIAFKTASYVDSRTILDRNGSEQLLGWGDMLYLPTGSFAPTRVQGCFLSDEEVNRIVTHVREANPSTYDPDILERVEEIASGGNTESTGADMIGGNGDMGGGDGNLFEQAVEYAIQDGQISTSTLQRRLKIGYARAGRLTDEMEERGIVAAKDGSKPRKCLITREEWDEMKKMTEGMA